MVHSQSEAKRFFVDKVVARAHVERVLLSDAERKMLFWSESDPDFVVDPQLPSQLAAEISDREYEKKIGGLLARSFDSDLAEDQNAQARWKQASDVLQGGDHYILVMVDQALGSRLKRWWQFWR